MANLRVSFNASIDNDDYQFETKAEAIAIAQDLTDRNSGGYDYNDSDGYKYMVFKEYVYTTVEDDDKTPLYAQISDVTPRLHDSDFSSVKRMP